MIELIFSSKPKDWLIAEATFPKKSKNEPWKVLYRAKPYLMRPQELYECVGDVPNVVFPCSTLCDAKTGRIAIYYGAADTVVALAFTQVDELVAWVKANS